MPDELKEVQPSVLNTEVLMPWKIWNGFFIFTGLEVCEITFTESNVDEG